MNDRDCDNCVHHTGGSCSVWECSYEPIGDDTISRQAVIDALCGECQGNCIPCESFPCGEVKAIQALPSAQPEPYIDSIVSEIEKTISETRENGKHHDINVRTNGAMICFGLQLALEIIEEKRNERHDI